MATKQFGIGIVGLGMALQPHALAIRDLEEAGRVRCLGGFSPSGDRRAGFAARWGWPVFDRLEALLNAPGLDLVLVLTPPGAHLPVAERVATAGKHLLVEKPLEIDLARAEALVAMADRAGVTLGVVFQHRWRPAALRLAEALAAGELGDLLSASATIRWWRDAAYFAQAGRGMRARDGGGVLLTQAIHTLDLLLHLAGPVARAFAFARTSPLRAIDTEDIVAASLEFASGAIGTLDATTVARPGFPERIELAGTKGSALLVAERLELHREGARPEILDHGSAGGGGADPMAFDHGPNRAMLAALLDAIEAGRPPPNAGASGLPVQRLITALLRSAAEGVALRP
ncbi:Gfo/Idh/MocA family oxidoreductase [Siccirubricoccus sp. KC 17139]|uniref:Gfo/Idh/MocA family oxidoreductase n=1 Tax=Siccirubricoccus soli TaxID=2899147 RepID=A0ABT1D1C0_9PROT|nr:Gfo/Idh/MocA family oxidoreductase [Siccirubricoccus soli]MCO6415442.1 Gfo/Idh/MocA family oxidoreductase [Siccirubricoccus soli]MCP2681574.1 Gfo/Idh/MocA family oxidoreductase [Siccirubricoccus soli]